MAETSWPSAAPATITEYDFERLWSAWYQSGLVGDPSLSSLIFADSTGLQVKARADRLAKVRGVTWYSGSSTVAVPITANNSGATRRDRVVLRKDRSTWTVRLAAVEGTPGEDVPALTQNPGPGGVWELLVAEITITDGAVTINPDDVTTRNTYLGAPLFVANNGDLTAEDAAFARQFFRYMPDEDRLEFNTQGNSTSGRRTIWRDSGEVAIDGSTPTWSGGPNRIRKVNQMVNLNYANNQRQSGGVLPTNVNSRLPGTIPSSMRPSQELNVAVRHSGGHAGVVVIGTNGAITLISHEPISEGGFVSGFNTTWLVV